MRTATKVLLLKITSFMISISIAIFCVAASAVIFSRSIELIANMGYTNHVEAGILIGIASLLIWIVILGADSAEHILKAGFKKAGNLQQGVNDE